MVLRNRQAHLVLLCSLLGSSAAQLRAVPFTRADTNADGTVNITDPINTLGFLFLGDPQSILCRDAADSNDDGQVNISDAINTLAFLFVGGTSIPEPGTTTCGLDPTLDALSCGVFPPCGPLLPPSVHDITPSSPTNVDMVTLSGATIPRAEVRVVGGAAVASVAADAEGRFSLTVLLEKNRLNRLFITASCPPRGASAPTAVEITQDAQPPSLFIDGPEKPQTEDTIQTFYKTITVYGRVADILSGFMGLQVTVAGEPAYVAEGIGTNGTFERRDVPLVIGDNEINVSARDQAGNVTTKAIFVRRTEVPAGPILIPAPHPLESGNNQGGMVGAELLKPIRVQVVRNGVPFAGKIVTFHVTRSDGRLSAVQGTLKEEGSLMLQVRSDADGMAQAYWTLGTDAGCGNNRVTATSTSVAGSVVFCASGTAAPPDRILIGSGNNQRVETGAPAPEALRAWVSDGCNGAREQSVTFTVVRGDGIVNGGTSATVLTTRTGHAQVSFTLGTQPGNNIVEATFPGNPGLPATFVIYGLERVENAPTVFSGIVLDNGGQPIEGVNCTLEFRATAATVGDTTDVNGLFRFDNLPDAGPAYVFVNGLAATHVGGSPGTDVPRGSFPFLLYDVVIVPNALNSLPAPIKLPKLDPDNERLYDGTRDVKLEVKGVQGLSMIVRTGTVVTVPGQHPRRLFGRTRDPGCGCGTHHGRRVVARRGLLELYGRRCIEKPKGGRLSHP